MARKFAVIFGVIFIVAGIMGFVPNPIIGKDAFFAADALHNLIHLSFGLILMIAATGVKSASRWLLVFGIISLIFFIDSLFQKEMVFGVIRSNTNDMWGYLIAGIIFIITSFFRNEAQLLDRTTV